MVCDESARQIDVAKLISELANRGFYVLGEVPAPELRPPDQRGPGEGSPRPNATVHDHPAKRGNGSR